MLPRALQRAQEPGTILVFGSDGTCDLSQGVPPSFFQGLRLDTEASAAPCSRLAVTSGIFLIASPGVSKTLVQEKMPFSFADSLSGLCWADGVPFAAAPQRWWWLADSRQEWLPWCFISSQKIYSRERGHAGSSMVCLSSDPSGKRLHCFYSQHLTLLLRLVNKEAN